MTFKSKRDLIAVETDGFSVLSLVMEMKSGKAKARDLVETTGPGFSRALENGCRHLRTRVPKLPRRAILVAHDVFPAVLELPVDPASPRSHFEMTELVRWEIEPYFSQAVTGYPIGTILVGKGWMSLEQFAMVLERSKHSQHTSTGTLREGGKLPSRFGEIAIQLGFVDRRQLQEGLELQEHLRAMGDNFVCGWMPVRSQQEAGPWKWLVCAINSSRRESYRKAFEACGLELESIYPLFGTNASSRHGKAGKQASLINVQKGALAHVELSGSSIEALTVHYHSHPAMDATKCLDFADLQNKEEVWIAGRSPEMKEIKSGLAGRISGQVEYLKTQLQQKGVSRVARGFLAGVTDAVTHAMGAAAEGSCVCVPVRDPAPPLVRRPVTWWAAAAVALLLSVGFSEYYFYSHERQKTTELTQLQGKLQRQKNEVEAIKKHNRTISALEEKLVAMRSEQEGVARKRVALERFLRSRTEYPAEVLTALGKSAGSDVSVERVVDHSDGTLEIDVWSLTEESLQRFAHAVIGELRDWQLLEAKSSVIPKIGQYELPGFALALLLESSKEGRKP